MLAIPEAPHHVLHPVGSVVQHEEETLSEAIKLETHQPFTFGEHQFAVLQVRRLIQPAIIESVVILRHSESGEQSNLLRYLVRVISRRAHRKHRRSRIDVCSRGIKLKMRLKLTDVKPRDTADRLQYVKRKFETHQLTPTSLRNYDLFVRAAGVDDQLASALVHAHANFAEGIVWRRLLRISGTDDASRELWARIHEDNLLVLLRSRGLALRVERPLALAAAQIRDSHSCQYFPIQRVGGERTRTAQHNAGHT